MLGYVSRHHPGICFLYIINLKSTTMTEEERLRYYFNEVENVTAVCMSKMCWIRGEYPELEIGKTYNVTHIGVRRSCTFIKLAGFEKNEYNSTCFDIMENGVSIDGSIARDSRFLAPYLKRLYLRSNMVGVTIPDHLRDIEKEYNVKILLAVESGSRAWGFESDNSDWDVRFVYVHKPEWYIRIEEQRDVIEHVYEDNVDLAGWELRKTLALVKRSNPSLLEWFHSPIVYFMDDDFMKRINTVENEFFNPVGAMYHYNHIYNKHNERYLQREECNMKRFLYYLRGILACRWIEMYKTLPPVPFYQLVDATVDDADLRDRIDKLIRIKAYGDECDLHVVDDKLKKYAEQWANYYNEIVSKFRPEMNEKHTSKLDSILYDMVMKQLKQTSIKEP